MKILLATQNKHKVEEFQRFSTGDIDFVASPEKYDIDEPYDTFLENALIKARTYAINTGSLSLSDDSGLIIPSLGGEPGVMSARYSSEDGFLADRDISLDHKNNLKVLEKMRGVKDREAIFVAVLVLIAPDMPASPIVAQGFCKGSIKNITPERLEEHVGFGYDGIFIPEGCTHSFAEMSSEEKGRISHRGKAVRSLMEILSVNKIFA